MIKWALFKYNKLILHCKKTHFKTKKSTKIGEILLNIKENYLPTEPENQDCQIFPKITKNIKLLYFHL